MSDNIKVGVTGVAAAGGTKSDYEFTQDWFQYGENLWPHLIEHLPERDDRRRIMEIGSFEGRSTVWLIENMMKDGDELVCVDTWAGGEEHSKINMGEVEARFDANVAKALGKFQQRALRKIKDTSTYSLAHQMRWMPAPPKMFDFIYIDGSHQASDVLADAVMAWQILRMGGIMVFDDYMWGDPRMPLHRPKISIDAFMNIFGAEIAVLHIGYQVAIKKQRLP